MSNNQILAPLIQLLRERIPYQWHLKAALVAAILFILLILNASAQQINFISSIIKTDETKPTISALKNKKLSPKLEIKNNQQAKKLFGTYLAPTNTISNTDLTLTGIFMGDTPRESAIILQEKSEPEKIYKLGDEVPGGGKIHKIDTFEVVIKKNGRLEKITLVMEDNNPKGLKKLKKSSSITTSRSERLKKLEQRRKARKATKQRKIPNVNLDILKNFDAEKYKNLRDNYSF